MFVQILMGLAVCIFSKGVIISWAGFKDSIAVGVGFLHVSCNFSRGWPPGA